MSTYLTLADFKTRLGDARAVQLSADSGATANDTLIQAIIDQAEGIIHAYLVTRIALPVSVATHPQTFAALGTHTFNLSRVQLATRQPPVPPDWKSEADESRKWLAGVADGKVLLPDAAAVGDVASWGSSPANASREDMV